MLFRSRDHTSLSLLMVDIDHFKAYNDTYGHVEGDTCLKKVAQGLASSLQRHVDKVARYGGEEFTVILPGTDDEGAMQVAERMKEEIARMDIEHCGSDTCEKVTISIGVSTVLPTREIKSTQLVDAADKALYQAKEAGRNRCCAENIE